MSVNSPARNKHRVKRLPNGTPLEIQFWNKVVRVPEGCWEWLGCYNSNGRASFQGVSAPRKAYEFANSVTLPKELYALHKCDNPGCVRPSHLFVGTQKENMRDCVAKGRMPVVRLYARKPKNPNTIRRGEQRSHKLTEEQVRLIRSLRKNGLTYKQIEERVGFPATWQNIAMICTRKTWTHIQD